MRSDPTRSERRRGPFIAASLAVGVGALVALEIALRALGIGGRPPLFVEVPDRPGFLQANPAVIERYAPASIDLGVAVEPIPFRAQKPEGTFRIVVQGASTAAGFPYGRWAGLAGMLGDRLEADLPEHDVEVITTAMAAVNSNTLVDLVDEILEIEPDAVLVYAGHNEYIGVLGVASALTPSSAETRVALGVRQLGLYRLTERSLATLTALFGASPEQMPLFERAAAAARVPFGSAAYQQGIDQLDRNLGEILGRYRAAGVPVYVGTLVSNLRSLPPFVPGPRPETDRARWDAAQERATRAAALGPEPQRRALDDWIAVDSRAPGAWYGLCAHLAGGGDTHGAWAACSRARDLDPLRFRAPSGFNARIRALAREHGARLVDVEAKFRRRSRGRVPGDELLLEHVHPNAEGYFLLADTYRDALAADGRIGEWPPEDEERARREMPITAIDRVLARWDAEQLLGGFPFRDAEGEASAPAGPSSSSPADPVEALALQLRRDEVSWAEAMEALMRHHRRAGHAREAATVARMVAQAYPADPVPNLAAGLLLLEQGEPRRALRYLERSVDAAPADRRAQAALERARRTAAAGP